MNNRNDPNLFQQVVDRANTPPPGPVEPPAKGLAMAGLVLGIVSLAVFVLNTYIPEFALEGSLIMSVIGIVLSLIAKKRGNRTGICTAGLTLSIISAALNGALMAACFGCFGCPAMALCSGCLAGM